MIVACAEGDLKTKRSILNPGLGLTVMMVPGDIGKLNGLSGKNIHRASV